VVVVVVVAADWGIDRATVGRGDVTIGDRPARDDDDDDDGHTKAWTTLEAIGRSSSHKPSSTRLGMAIPVRMLRRFVMIPLNGGGGGGQVRMMFVPVSSKLRTTG
jgi:hypothetical protein